LAPIDTDDRDASKRFLRTRACRRARRFAGSAKGCTASLLTTHGFASSVIAGLVDTGLVVATTERILVGQRPIDMTWFEIADRGRATLNNESFGRAVQGALHPASVGARSGIQWVATIGITLGDVATQPKLMSY
jgi:hypothetical protein